MRCEGAEPAETAFEGKPGELGDEAASEKAFLIYGSSHK